MTLSAPWSGFVAGPYTDRTAGPYYVAGNVSADPNANTADDANWMTVGIHPVSDPQRLRGATNYRSTTAAPAGRRAVILTGIAK